MIYPRVVQLLLEAAGWMQRAARLCTAVAANRHHVQVDRSIPGRISFTTGRVCVYQCRGSFAESWHWRHRAGYAWKCPYLSPSKFLKAAEPYQPTRSCWIILVFKAQGVAAEGELSLGFEALSGSWEKGQHLLISGYHQENTAQGSQGVHLGQSHPEVST